MRIDSGYYSKKYLSAINSVKTTALGVTSLGAVTQVLRKGIFDIKSESYCEAGIPFVRISNIKNCVISDQNLAHISPDAHALEHKTALQFQDFVLSKTAYAAASLVTVPECNVSQDTIACKLTKKAEKYLLSPYIIVYLNSYIGLNLTWRLFQGNVQLHLSLPDAASIPIPLFTLKFQLGVTKLFEKSLDLQKKSKTLRAQAEQTLLTALNLDNWQPPNPLTYESKASEAFTAGRMDAEFFRPRVEKLFKLLGDRKQTIQNIASLRKEKFNGCKNQFNYLEIGAVSRDGSVTNSMIAGEDAPSRATWKVHEGDILTSTVRPIRGLTAIVSSDQDGAVASSGFAVLEPQSVSSELLMCYLKLPVICELMDLHTSASMYPAIAVPDILDLPFKHPGKKTEALLIKKLQEAKTTRQQSKLLLERAKRAVEIAIEQDEKTAMAYLDGKHYVAEEILPRLFAANRHYVNLDMVKSTLKEASFQYEDSTLKSYLHEWKQEGKLYSAGRGWYSDLAEPFVPDTSIIAPLVKTLDESFPYLEWTAWSTRQLAAFFHHLPSRHATFLMVDRDAMSTVAETLSDVGYHVVSHPLGAAAKQFQLEADDTIILRPRLSSDHTERHAPPEQILVDLHHECQKLALFDTSELERVKNNLINRYRVSVNSCERYSKRRKTNGFTIT